MGISAPLGQRQGQRQLNRLRLGVPASLSLTHGKARCLIDDISACGARLRIERPLVAGQTALLMFHQLEAFGAIVWSRNGACGLQFDKRLDGEDMQGMLWITENREFYARICEEEQVHAWTDRI